MPEHFGQTLFSQPPLCRHAGTDNWGTVENWEDDAVCVFGVSFAKDDGRYVLDRGASTDYELFMTEPHTQVQQTNVHS